MRCKNVRAKTGCCAPPPPEPALWICKSGAGDGGHEIVVLKRVGSYKKKAGGGGEADFGSFEISVQEICNGDYYRPLIVKLMDLSNSNKPREMCRSQTSLNSLTEWKGALAMKPSSPQDG